MDAQVRAADAAEEQVLPSWLNAALGFIGTGLIVWTLYETRIANAVARREFARARIDSKKAYAEARKSNEIAQKTAADQLRPYVQFTDPWGPEFKLKFENGEKIDFAFENFGQIPASDVSICYCWEIMGRPIGDRTIGHFTEAESYGRVGPRQLIKDKFRIEYTPSEIARIAGGEILMIRMRLDYKWGETESDFHDVTHILGNTHGEWEIGQISKQERQRT